MNIIDLPYDSYERYQYYQTNGYDIFSLRDKYYKSRLSAYVELGVINQYTTSNYELAKANNFADSYDRYVNNLEYDYAQLQLYENSKDFDEYVDATELLKQQYGIKAHTFNNYLYDLGIICNQLSQNDTLIYHKTKIGGVAIRKSLELKCSRCWHHNSTVGANAEHPELCSRCLCNVFGIGEVRNYV